MVRNSGVSIASPFFLLKQASASQIREVLLIWSTHANIHQIHFERIVWRMQHAWLVIITRSIQIYLQIQTFHLLSLSLSLFHFDAPEQHVGSHYLIPHPTNHHQLEPRNAPAYGGMPITCRKNMGILFECAWISNKNVTIRLIQMKLWSGSWKLDMATVLDPTISLI